MKSPALAALLLLALLTAVGRGADLDWQPLPGGRSAALTAPAEGKAGFSLLAPATTGIQFTNLLPAELHLTNQILLNGSGVAAGDVDGDGWCDLYFCRLVGPNALYRNLGGWKFEEVPGAAGATCTNAASTGAAFADLDGDGDLDLIVNSVGNGSRVFFNDGRGRFAEFPRVLNPGRCGTSLAVGDLDGDGFPDFYAANYRTSALMDMPNTRFLFQQVNGRSVVWKVNGRLATEPDLTNRFTVNARGGIDEAGEPDALYRNVGGTNFQPVSFTDGAFLDEEGRALTKTPFDWGLSVCFRDLNGDGRPDIYVANDFDSPDRIWLNEGGWKFRALPALALRKTSLFSMGVDVADINRDGHDDLFVLDMLTRDHSRLMDTSPDRRAGSPAVGEIALRRQYSYNTLQLGRGDGTWAEIAQLAGVQAAEWAWAAAFLDVDLDGWEDLLITNGNERDARSLDMAEKLRALRTGKELTSAQILANRQLFSRLNTPNLAYRNRGDLTFEDASRAWGFDLPAVSHGLAFADLDRDGDLDVIVNNLNDPAAIYRNESAAPRVAVRLKGARPNTEGVGARVSLFGGAVPAQAQEMMAGGRYVADDETLRVFAAGRETNVMRLEIAWRSGRRTVLAGVRANRIYEVDEAAPAPGSAAPVVKTIPLFTDVSERLQHTHVEEAFDDHAVQPTLPHRLSQLGPGVSWCDLDGDGAEDLVIASGKGGRLAAFRGDGRGGFTALAGAPWTQPVTRDQTTVLAWPRAPGQTVLLAGSANWEDGMASGAGVRQFDLAARRVEDSLPSGASSTGPLALADVDGDGDLDLFVGGRALPGKYPRAATSLLLRNQDGRLEPDAEHAKTLAEVGLVSGAVFTDLNGDGWPELVLACEWGPLKIFQNERGRLKTWNPPLNVPALHSELLTLRELTGWWTGVTAADVDGDGRLDLIASNWGRNTKYEAHRPKPLVLLHADFDGDGTEEMIEAHHDAALGKLVPWQRMDFLARTMPFVKERFNSNRAFGNASVEEIFGEWLKPARRLEAVWLESTVLLNRGDRFEARPLPAVAQFAPTFGVSAADFDGDGAVDVFLAQNFFGVLPETPRYDAGRGLVLRGDGRGGFQALAGQFSGVVIYGEQRGSAVADFDGDGRTDLAVGQNGGATKLFQNTGGRPGLRVRLAGPASNPRGIGASVQGRWGERLGPALELHAGSGYWSQDSAVVVITGRLLPEAVRVRWPGGQVTTVPVPPGTRELRVEAAK